MKWQSVNQREWVRLNKSASSPEFVGEFRPLLGLCPRPRHFLRYGSDVPKLAQRTRPWPGIPEPGPDTPWAHRRPGYPSAGCLPAEPASVFPGTAICPSNSTSVQPLGTSEKFLENAGGLGAEPPFIRKNDPRILVRSHLFLVNHQSIH